MNQLAQEWVDKAESDFRAEEFYQLCVEVRDVVRLSLGLAND
jgi:hypothetical protein